MAYKISDKIFYLKIDEQVEYLTNIINDEIDPDIQSLKAKVNDIQENKQNKTDKELQTEVKTIVGAINEILEKHIALETKVNNNEVASQERDNQLQTKINNNEVASQERDNQLQTKIDNNEVASQERDNQLQTKINNNEVASQERDNQLQTKLETFETSTNAVLQSHTNSIKSINDNINDLNNNKQAKVDNNLLTESKEIVGAINENRDEIASNRALIDIKQDKEDTSLITEDKTIVGAINNNTDSIKTLKKTVDDNKSQLVNSISQLYEVKQEKTDNALQTTSKTVVGAINEINAKPSGGSKNLYRHYVNATIDGYDKFIFNLYIIIYNYSKEPINSFAKILKEFSNSYIPFMCSDVDSINSIKCFYECLNPIISNSYLNIRRLYVSDSESDKLILDGISLYLPNQDFSDEVVEVK